MSTCFQLRRSASIALVLAAGLLLLPTLSSAQDEAVPKVELFVGYQWLNPGGNIPQGVDVFGNPISFKLPSMPGGVGTSLAYNFTKNWALEVRLRSELERVRS